MSYHEYWNNIYQAIDNLNNLTESYWKDYSDFSTWQFWLILMMAILPLIVLFFSVDRKRLFEVLFFGYTIHILWNYISEMLENHLFFVHKYFLTAVLPPAFSMTAVVLPVSFLLLYQYCTNHQKSFYVWTLVLSAFFAFVVASMEEMLGMVDFLNGLNKFYIFLIDVGIAYFAYWFTRLLLRMRSGVNNHARN